MKELTKKPMVDVLSEQIGRQVVVSGDKYVYLDTKEEVEASIAREAEIKNHNDFLQLLKDAKSKEINIACKNDIESGFVSNALGAEHTYQSGQIDQLNLIGLVASGADDYFKADGEYKLHTAEQLQQVLNDGKTYKQTLLQKANMLKSKIIEATTEEEIEGIAW